MASQSMQRGGPYLPQTWPLGGLPKKSVDVPITAVFLVLFIIGAATHMTIFQLNRRRGHKFLFNVVLFGFCMARITTCILRIASISLPAKTNLAIAATVFVAAGVLIIFIINLIWSQRVLRSLHPTIGWHRGLSMAFKALYLLIVLTLIVTIIGTVQSFFTLRPRTRKIDHSLQLYGQTFLAVISSIPILVVLTALAIPRRNAPEKFGIGRQRVKIAVLLTGSVLVSLGAWYRCGTSWKTPVPHTRPLPGYYSKACFYIFNFVVEIITVYLYAIMRVDLRFHVPNGAKGPGSYSKTALPSAGDSANIADEEQGEAIRSKKLETHKEG